MKRFTKWVLRSAGYKLKRVHPADRAREGKWPVQVLSGLGDPKTVIDVGVGHGTPDLYRSFPDADLLLVEPLHEFESDIKSILAHRRGVAEMVALSAEPGEATIDIGNSLTTSSLHTRTKLTEKNVIARRTVPLRTLDDVVFDHGLTPPFVVKIDTEGHELAVIRGGHRTLAQTQLVIAEVSVARRFDDSYRFGQLTSDMYSLGFDLIEILQMQRSPDGSLRRLDAVFGRVES